MPVLSGMVQAGLFALPAGGLPSLLSVFPRKQLTGLAVLFLEMFNRPSSGRAATDGWAGRGDHVLGAISAQAIPRCLGATAARIPQAVSLGGCRPWWNSPSLARRLPEGSLLTEDRRLVTTHFKSQQLRLMHCVSLSQLCRGHLAPAEGHFRLQL